MSENHFYLEDIYKEPDQIFSFEYKSIDDIKETCIFILDTNILLVPFYTSKESFELINKIFKKLKSESRLLIPARAAREFGKNRPNKIGDVFFKLRQLSQKINSGDYTIESFPLLESNSAFIELKDNFQKIKDLIKEARKNISKIENDITSWNWNDQVSKEYREIFTSEIIIEAKKDKKDIVNDLKNRIAYKIAPGFKDSSKVDDGIGDLLIWQTILEIGKDRTSDVIFVTNETKNDWFIKQDNTALYPRFELFEEFRSFTQGKSINLVNFPKFLELCHVPESAVNEIKESIQVEKAKDESLDEIAKWRPLTQSEAFQLGYTYNLDARINSKILHPKFGEGIVMGMNTSDGQKKIDVFFFDAGPKTLLTKYALLKFSEG